MAEFRFGKDYAFFREWPVLKVIVDVEAENEIINKPIYIMERIIILRKVLQYLLLALPFATTAQNVGIGTATPAQKLHVAGAGQTVRVDGLSGVGTRAVYVNNNGDLTTIPGAPAPEWLILGNAGINAAANFIGTTDNIDFRIRTFNTERITVKNNGFIGLFTNAPASYLQSIPPALISNFHFQWDNNLNGDAPARFQNSVASNGNRCFLGTTNFSGTGLQASAVIGLALNATNTSPTLAGGQGVQGFSNSVSGIGVIGGFVGGSTAVIGWAVFANGWAGGITPWAFVSDKRLKKDVTTLVGAIDKIKQVRGVEYNYDHESFPNLTLSDQRQIGFIAQELESVFPSMVHEKGIPYNVSKMADGSMSSPGGSYLLKTVSYTDMIPVLVEALKEQQKMIEDLQAKVDALEKNK